MHKVPYIQDDFGFDFTIKTKNDLTIFSVRLEDNYGEFIPVPFLVWNEIVNEKYHPLIMQKYTGIHPQIAYDQAIIYYCRHYAHTYICYN